MKRKFSEGPVGDDGVEAERPARSHISEIIEISSDDDIESITPMPHKPPLIELFDSDDADEAATTRFKKPANEQQVHRFRDWFNRTVPIHLIPKDIFTYMVGASFLRLESAKKLDISIDRIFVDQDALLCWDNYQWDPEDESFHEHAQSRLTQFQTAIEFGPFVLERLLSVANTRLQEAKGIGLSTADLLLAADLCITWNGRVEHEEMVSYDSEESSGAGENCNAAVADAVPVLPKPRQKKDNAPEVISVFGANFILAPSVHSDTSTDSELEFETEYDDEITLRNFVHPEPILEENDTRHIARDVLVAGGEEDHIVDLEVYLCDENIESMPCLELAIDKDGFEYHHNVEDAIDLEFGFDIVNEIDAVSTESESESETDSDSESDGRIALIVEHYDEDEIEEVLDAEEEDEDNNGDDYGEESIRESGLIEEIEQEHFVGYYADDESEISEEE